MLSRLLAAPLAVAAAVLVPALPASAASVCAMSDQRLDEVSGIAALPGGGYVVMNDGKPGTTVLRLYVLGARCQVTRTIVDRSYDPFDTEDLARTADGTLWIGDIGDNDRERKAPAVLRLPAGAARGTRYQLRYPGPPADAEALLIQPDRRAVVVTKSVSGIASVLVSERPLTGPAATIGMTEAGRVTIEATSTPGGPISGGISSVLITGGAATADGSRIALRTYTDAYEWDVTAGDFAAALTRGEPRRTPIPGEKQGESLAYTPDGRAFVTTSEGVGAAIQTWTPAARASASPSPGGRASAAPAPDPGRVCWKGVAVGAGAAVVLGAAAVALLVGARRVIRRARRRR